MNEKNVNKYDDMLFLQIKLSKDLNPSINLSVKNKKAHVKYVLYSKTYF